jgi:hypothetical protein
MQQRHEHPDGSGFARAIGTEETEDIAFLYLKGDVGDAAP